MTDLGDRSQRTPGRHAAGRTTRATGDVHDVAPQSLSSNHFRSWSAANAPLPHRRDRIADALRFVESRSAPCLYPFPNASRVHQSVDRSQRDCCATSPTSTTSTTPVATRRAGSVRDVRGASNHAPAHAPAHASALAILSIPIVRHGYSGSVPDKTPGTDATADVRSHRAIENEIHPTLPAGRISGVAVTCGRGLLRSDHERHRRRFTFYENFAGVTTWASGI
jgi:hypothetical protein